MKLEVQSLFTKDLADNLAKVGHQVVILTTGKKRIRKNKLA